MLTDLKTYPGSMQANQAEDPDEQWINTPRAMGLPVINFYKWLAYPYLTPQERKTLPKDRFWRVAGWTTRTRYEKRRLGLEMDL
jgi:hypothetical protein